MKANRGYSFGAGPSEFKKLQLSGFHEEGGKQCWEKKKKKDRNSENIPLPRIDQGVKWALEPIFPQ